jgi:Ras-related protein Rab-1A
MLFYMNKKITNIECDYIYKYVVIGEAGVGKTSIVRQYVYNDYGDNYNTTIGVDFSCKTMTVQDKIIRIQIWDTAGQESFRSIINTYYKNAIGVIIVVDDNTPSQLENIKYWKNEYYKKQKNTNPTVFFMVILNKIDQFDKNERHDLIHDYCDDNNILFYGTSAKSGCNINECFRNFTNNIHEKTKDMPHKVNGIKKYNNTIDLHNPHQYRYNCCNIV